MAMKKGLLRKSCFVERTHSQSPFERGVHGALRRHERVHRLRDSRRAARCTYPAGRTRSAGTGAGRSVRAPSRRSRASAYRERRWTRRAASALDATRTTRGEGGEPARDGCEGRRHRRAECAGSLVARKWRLQPPRSGSRAKINRLRFVDSADASPRAVTRRREGWRRGTNCRSAGAETVSHNARHADASSREPRRSSASRSTRVGEGTRRVRTEAPSPRLASRRRARRTTQRRAVQKRERHEPRYQKAFTIPDGFPMILKGSLRGAAPPTRLAAPPRVPRPRELRSRSRSRPAGTPIHHVAARRERPTRPSSRACAPSSAPQTRAQPDNIYEFGATYFADKIGENERGKTAASARLAESSTTPQGEDSDCGAVGMFDMTDDELRISSWTNSCDDADQTGTWTVASSASC